MENGNFRLNPKAVAAINAVEGLYLSDEGQNLLENLRRQNITQDKRRELVREAFKARST